MIFEIDTADMSSLLDFRMIIRKLPQEIQYRILLIALFDSLIMRPVPVLDHMPFMNWSQIRPRNKQILLLFLGYDCRCSWSVHPLNRSRPCRSKIKNDIEFSEREGYEMKILYDVDETDYIFVA